MTDIDFDELDKAVSSTLGARAEKKPDTATASVASEAIVEKPSEEAPEGDKVQVEVKSRQTIISPAAKRSGRFMDMVHPSSDMAQEKTLAPASRIKIEPTQNAPKPDLEDAVKPDELAKVEDSDPSEPQEVSKEAPAEEVSAEPKIAYPDPLDVVPLNEPKIDEKPVDEEEEPLAVAVAVASAPVAAGETPFLPDAKVEKRPLGGPAMDMAESETAPSDEQLPPEAELPPALQSEVVAVESDDLPDDDETEEQKPEKEVPKEEVRVEKKEAPAPSTGLSQSIPQQYHSAAETTDETPRPVFDTDQYHQPLIPAHAGKKSGPWLFIFLILALLLVGAGLGYFAYVSGF